MRIRLTNRKTNETINLSGVPPEALPALSVTLGAYGVLVQSAPELGPDVPVCRCLFTHEGSRLTDPTCDFHKEAVQDPTVQAPVRTSPAPNVFAEALFKAAVDRMLADAKLLRAQRAVDPGGDL